MKSVTVRELRNEFPRVEAWIREGEAVSITKRGAVVAILTSPSATVSRGASRKPNIMARLKETWGSRIFSKAEVDAMRSAELAGEEG